MQESGHPLRYLEGGGGAKLEDSSGQPTNRRLGASRRRLLLYSNGSREKLAQTEPEKTGAGGSLEMKLGPIWRKWPEPEKKLAEA